MGQGKQTQEKQENSGEMRLTIFFLDTAGDKISWENELAEGVAIPVQASILSGHNYTITVLTSGINHTR
jgi:hypothetical protein